MHAQSFKGLPSMARTMALPGDNKPLRYPSYPALERTAVLALNHSSSWVTPTTESRVILTRQAAYPLWAEVSTRYYAIVSYLPSGANFPKAEISPAPVATSVMGKNVGTHTMNISIAGLYPSTAYDAPYMGADDGTGPNPWLFVPRNANLNIAFKYDDAPSVDDVPYVEYEQWVEPGESIVLQAGGTFGAGVVALVPIGSVETDRWIRPTMVATTYLGTTLSFPYGCTVVVSSAAVTATATGVQLGASGDITMTLPVAKFSDYKVTALPWSSTRVTATSLLLTNTTKALNKEGTVLWGRVNPSQYDPFNIPSNTVASFHPAEKAFLPLEQGTYTYTMPSTDMARFVDYTMPLVNEVNTIPVYRLDNTGMVNVGFIQDSDVTNPTLLAVNLDIHFEFRTSASLFQIGMSVAPVEALHQAQIALLSTGFFFQNESHKSVISKLLAQAGKLHPLMQFMGPVGRGISGAIEVASKFARAAPHKPPPSTLPVAVSQKKKMASGLDLYLASVGRSASKKPAKPAGKSKRGSGKRKR